MADLVSMKTSAAEREARYSPKTMALDAPIYPYGLAVNLEEDSLKKLGIDDLPEVGGKMTLIATVEVISANQTKTTDGTNRSLSLQITELCLEPERTAKSIADKLYGG